MKRKMILAIAMTIGIVMLSVVQPEVSPHALDLKGTVKSVHEKGKITFLTFIPEDFSVVSFDQGSIDEGKHTLHGHLQEYACKVEFVVDSAD